MKRINIVIVLIAVGMLTGCGNYGRVQSNQNTKPYETVENKNEEQESDASGKEEISKENELDESKESETMPSKEEVIEIPQMTEKPEPVVTEMPIATEQPIMELPQAPTPKPTEVPKSTPKPTETPVEVKPSGDSLIDKELNQCEQDAKEIERKLQDAATQTEMNKLSSELYSLWDEELNSIWKQLMEKMNEQEKKSLRAEEKEWIADKEAALQKLTNENEGGSISPLQTNLKGAELTKARVYVLADYLRKYE